MWWWWITAHSAQLKQRIIEKVSPECSGFFWRKPRFFSRREPRRQLAQGEFLVLIPIRVGARHRFPVIWKLLFAQHGGISWACGKFRAARQVAVISWLGTNGGSGGFSQGSARQPRCWGAWAKKALAVISREVPIRFVGGGLRSFNLSSVV